MAISGKKIAIGAAAVLGTVGIGLLARRQFKKSNPLHGLKVISRVTSPDGRTMTVYRGKVDIDGRLFLIEQQVAKALKDPRTRTLATAVTASCARDDQECAARKVFEYVHKNVKYVSDPSFIMHEDGKLEAIDMYNGANYTLSTKAGDCGNKDVVIGALLGSIGVRTFSRAAAYEPGGPYRHVYRMAKINGRPVALDTTLQPAIYGREVPAVKIFDFPKV
jgi:hypothetical protein